jgi:death-on-curing protein
MRYLSGDELVYLHARIISTSGGIPGAKDEGAVQTLPTKVRMAQVGQEIFQDLFFKAGTFLHSIVNGQPFHDGNKRAGIAAAAVLLALNDQFLTASDHEIVDLCRAVERGSMDAMAIGQWLKAKSTARG